MKTIILKAAFATACVVAAGMGGFKAYTASNQSESSMLLAENVEALSDNDGDKGSMKDVARYIQLSRGLKVTKITGSISQATQLGLSIGKIIDGGVLDAAFKAGLRGETNDVPTYRETCFYKKGSNCACVETDWIACGASCPKSCGTN